MTDREKLAEILRTCEEIVLSWACGYGQAADHLIANGVVVREKGEWIDRFVRDWRCSKCGEPIYKVRNVDGYCYDDKPSFCPNCGADMRKGENDGKNLF